VGWIRYVTTSIPSATYRFHIATPTVDANVAMAPCPILPDRNRLDCNFITTSATVFGVSSSTDSYSGGEGGIRTRARVYGGSNLGARAKGKRLGTLRAFFRSCMNRNWLHENPVSTDIKPPMGANRAANQAPYTDEELQRIIDV
jgi:hypothetical protein